MKKLFKYWLCGSDLPKSNSKSTTIVAKNQFKVIALFHNMYLSTTSHSKIKLCRMSSNSSSSSDDQQIDKEQTCY